MANTTMIENERQYRVTKNQAEAFASDLGNLSAQPGDDSLMRELEEGALRSQLEVLQQQLQEYEELRSGDRAMHEASATDPM